MNITATTDRRLVRADGHSTRYVHAVVTAPEAPRRANRTPVNVALVLDRSGSMGGQKIVLVKAAAERALRMLHPDDRFALVVYDDEIDVLMESRPCTQDAREEALRRLASIDARGTTDLSGGWLKGCEQVARFIESNTIGRCLLLTDGLANRGILDPEELIDHVTQLRRRGVVTSTFGVGADFDEQLLQRMADAGAGHFYFIERAEQIVDLLTSELGEALEVVARGVTVTAQAPAGARIELLNPWSVENASHGLVASLGDLVSSQELSLVYRITLPEGRDGDSFTLSLDVAETMNARAAAGRVQWTFASTEACRQQTRNSQVDEAVAAIYASRARAEAIDANRRGDYSAARRVIEATVAKILSYAGANRVLRETAEKLQREAPQFDHEVASLSLKAMHMGTHAAMRSRTPVGAATKSPRRSN